MVNRGGSWFLDHFMFYLRPSFECLLPNKHVGGRDFSLVPWPMVLVTGGVESSQVELKLSPQGYRIVLRYVAGTMISKAAT